MALGFDTNDRVIRDLQVDAAILDLLVEDFSKMLKEERFSVFTFVDLKDSEESGGLNSKVVEDASATLGDARER